MRHRRIVGVWLILMLICLSALPILAATTCRKGANVLCTADDTLDMPNLLTGGVPVSTGGGGGSATEKSPVLVATTANIALSGEQTIDGVLTSASRILVWRQTDQTTNGIYVTGAAGWLRATDADFAAEFVSNFSVYVQSGTLSGQSVFRFTTTAAVTLGTTALTFERMPHAITVALTNLPTNPLVGVIYVVTGTDGSCSDPGTVTTLCWSANGSTYLKVNAQVPVFDVDGELLNPEISTGSFISNGAGAPAAGSCPHNKAFYRDTTLFGDTYVCYGVGQNWHLIGEFDDAINGLIPETGTTVAAVGATNVTMTGGACLEVTGNNTTKTLTTDLICGSDARGDVLVRGTTAYGRLALGPTLRGTLSGNGIDVVVGTSKALVYTFGCDDEVGVTTASYFLRHAAYSTACNATEGYAGGNFQFATRTGVVQNLYCGVSDPPGGTDTLVYTVRAGGVATAVTCTITGAATTCNNTVNSGAISAGQTISISYNPSADETLLTICSVEVDYL